MKFVSKIIFFFLTALILCAQYLHFSPLTEHYPRTLIRFQNTDKLYVNQSPSPSPSPSPLPSEAPAPLQHVHRRKRHHLPLVPPYTEDHDEKRRRRRRRRRVVVAVMVSVSGSICIICVIGVLLLFKGFWKRKSSSKNVRNLISAPVHKNFYLESLGNVLEPPPVCSFKQDSYNSECEQQQQVADEGEHNDFIITNHLSNSGNVHCSTTTTTTGVVASMEALKFDEEEEEQVYFGSPIAEETINLEESHSSDDESFHSFCNSHDSCNPRISDVSINNDALPSPSPPPPPPPPPCPTIFPSTKSTLKTVSCQKKPESYEVSNQTPIPPPPVPPPFPKGSTLLPPPPPPPQSQMGKDGSPLPKLKPLHWDKVRAAPNRSMVWDKLRSSSFEFDEEMIESLFSYNLHNSNEEIKSKSPSPSKHVLEPKRLQNLTILLKALNVTAEQVCFALVQGNGLNLQQLEVLIKMEPTKEEEAKLRGHKGDMGPAETFVSTILTIPYAFSRIEALLYRETFEDEVNHLHKTFSVLEEACKELRSSRLFLKLLEAVLKTGNRMNVGTIRGGAKAFKLDALLKLADVKGTDGKTTLLHFVVQEIVRSEGLRASESIIGKINQKGQQRNMQQREEDYRTMGLELVAGLSTELCNVKKTATIDFEVIVSSVSNLSQGMERLQRLVNQDLLENEKTCKFGESMQSFIKYAVKHLKDLEEDEHKVLELVKEITEYFHGNMSKDDANPLRIFVTVRDFLAMLDGVCRELKRSKVFNYPNPLAPFQ